MPTAYTAQIRKLRLPDQDDLKNASERCSADPRMLESIGRAVGQQVRIVRSDAPGFAALFTVKSANPAADSGAAARPSIVRTGQTGRERLGATDDVAAVVQAAVVDSPPRADEPVGVRFFEAARQEDARSYAVVIAPHGGDIERDTDEQATCTLEALIAAGVPVSSWVCRGSGDATKGAFDRWHITSTDLQPACFPLLASVMTRRFRCGVAFHGFDRKEDEADVYVGGGASLALKTAVARALNRLKLPIAVKISSPEDDPKFQGFSPENLINRLTANGLHLEQSAGARREFHSAIARAVAAVFVARRRRLPTSR